MGAGAWICGSEWTSALSLRSHWSTSAEALPNAWRNEPAPGSASLKKARPK
ncbi:hypothetical protein D3C83_161600 [compost metagenome]